MKTQKYRFFLTASCASLLLLCTIIASCKSNSVSPSTSATNSPVIANAANAFSFALDGNNFSSSYRYALTFTTDSVAIVVTSGNYATGKVNLSITDSAGMVVFQDSVLTNKVVAQAEPVNNVPKSCNIVCSDYSGSLVFTLSGQNGQK
jgi:hypothetical protein